MLFLPNAFLHTSNKNSVVLLPSSSSPSPAHPLRAAPLAGAGAVGADLRVPRPLVAGVEVVGGRVQVVAADIAVPTAPAAVGTALAGTLAALAGVLIDTALRAASPAPPRLVAPSSRGDGDSGPLLGLPSRWSPRRLGRSLTLLLNLWLILCSWSRLWFGVGSWWLRE